MPHLEFNANPTLGALLIAALLSSFLFGILTVQINFYYSKFSHDHLLIRILVASVWLIEFGHLLAVCYAVHIWTISDYGQPGSLATPPHGLGVSILLSGFIAPVIQAYFADRIRVLSSSIYGSICSCILWFFSFVRCLGSFAIAAEALRMVSLSQFESDFRWLITSTLAVGTFTDTVICAILICYVRPKYSQNKILVASVNDQLVAWTIRNGLIACLISVSVLVSFLAVRNAFIWHSLFVLLTRVFSNFLLSSLNSRSKKPKSENQMSTEPSTLYTFSDILSTPRFAPPSPKGRQTMLSTTTDDPLSTIMSIDEERHRTETFSSQVD